MGEPLKANAYLLFVHWGSDTGNGASWCRILFWTDWDASMPRIEAASMSGEGRKTIHKETGNGGWPNGLTVDYLERRILWIDAR